MSQCLQRSVADRRGQDEVTLIIKLAEVIWGRRVQAGSREARLYLEFYDAHTATIDLGLYSPETHNDVVSLIDFIKNNRQQNLAELSRHLKSAAARLPWLQSTDTTATKKVLGFGASLWLMIDTKGWQDDEPLQAFVHRQFPPCFQKAPTSVVTDLLFNGRMLHQIGGMEIIWTSNIREHLRITEDAIFLFRHASYLSGNQTAAERDIWPPRFLLETAQTIAILFPFSESPRKRWDRRIRKKADLNIEAGISCNTPRNLDHYVYWHDRLSQIQIAFDRARPNKLRQWLYDKRDSNQYYTFWFAVLAITLTLLFGLAQTVTGIIQVVIS